MGLRAERTGHAPSRASPERRAVGHGHARGQSAAAGSEIRAGAAAPTHEAAGARNVRCGAAQGSGSCSPSPLSARAPLGAGQKEVSCSCPHGSFHALIETKPPKTTLDGQTGDGPPASTCVSEPGPTWGSPCPWPPGPGRPCLTSGCAASSLACSRACRVRPHCARTPQGRTPGGGSEAREALACGPLSKAPARPWRCRRRGRRRAGWRTLAGPAPRRADPSGLTV